MQNNTHENNDHDTNLASRFELLHQEANKNSVFQSFGDSVKETLSQNPKKLVCFYFYDEVGSQLFEEICQLDEYYLTRSEAEILQKRSSEIAELMDKDTVVVELGSGSSVKTRKLISSFIQKNGKLEYVPIDISSSILIESSKSLLNDFPQLKITAVAAEYRTGLSQIKTRYEKVSRIILWLGSSIGNFEKMSSITFLKEIRSTLNKSDAFLLGTDLFKSEEILVPAYNDAKGVTAKFNFCLLYTSPSPRDS
eukprot:TRINITY_DN5031_c0_g1_i3.p1 TRINITY_DN5031_c0_g1~~TRINITY_DN5031_c0_g1_i3.p1  ORF type:complete len:252 (+),score=37.40 TRINITY_DN5031_c0_g1_i3:38-793(+)